MNLKTIRPLAAYLLIVLSLLPSAMAASAQGRVSIANAVPTVSSVLLLNEASVLAPISLSAGGSIVLLSTATVTDINGGSDINSASASFYHSSSNGTNDENSRLTNDSCTLGPASGNNRPVNCSFSLNYMALNGSWSVNISALDISNATASSLGNNSVNGLAALELNQSAVDFGSLAPGVSSTAPANMSIKSQGNVMIDVLLSGTNYTCTSGSIPVDNTRYRLIASSYESMFDDLTEGAALQAGMNLDIRGVATANGVDSIKSEYWTILIPSSGISGNCSNTITVTAIEN